MNKSDFKTLTDQIEQNRHFTGYYKKLTIPPIPKGNESQVYKIGDFVKSSPTYTMRNQIGAILDTYNNNGYIRYIVQWKGMQSSSDCSQSDIELF